MELASTITEGEKVDILKINSFHAQEAISENLA